MVTPSRHAVVLVTLAALAAGCASTSGTGVTAGPSTTTAAATPTGSAAAPQALQFSATTVDGSSFHGTSLAGKPAVLWFWAAWCPRCKGDAAGVRDLQQELAGKVNIVGVAGLGSGADGMKKFIADYQLGGFPQLADDTGAVWTRFEVPSQHYYIVLDNTGAVVQRGPMTLTQLRQHLDSLS